MRIITLSMGMVAIVDDSDYEFLSRWKWCATKNREFWYAVRNAERRIKPSKIYMHRVIAGAIPGQKVDHLDHNTLNNQRMNLRIATQSQNSANMKMRSYNTSGFKGVKWSKAAKKWAATAFDKHLGLFENKQDAARAYDMEAMDKRGDFALTNKKLGLLP